MPIVHAKTDTIADWNQEQLNYQIQIGNYPSGTTIADIVLPSDWNAAHILTEVVEARVTIVTGTYEVLPTDATVKCTGSSPYTVTMPSAVGISGKLYNIKSGNSATLTVATTGSQYIDDVQTFDIVIYECLTLQSDGTNWMVL
jgi:hypothetical protein